MKKIDIQYWTDIGLIVSFFVVAITGAIKFPGLLSSFGIDYTSLPRGTLRLIHDWSGAVMSFLVLIHLVLEWKCLVAMTKNMLKKFR